MARFVHRAEGRLLMGGRGPTLVVSKSGDASGSTTSSSSATVTSNSVTASYTGGLAGGTAVWTRVSGAFTITSPNAFSTTFSDTLSPGAGDSGVARCTVTSPDGQVDHVDVNVALSVVGPALAVSIAPAGATFGRAGAGTVTGNWTISATGGSGSYSFSWTLTTSLGDIITGSGSAVSFSKAMTVGQSFGGNVEASASDTSWGGSGTNSTSFAFQCV